MANWQRTLNLLPEWKQAKEGKITVSQLAGVIAERLASLEPFENDSDGLILNEHHDEIVDEFNYLARDPDTEASDFDCVMEMLYNWADTPLDTSWNGKKVCWVKTIG